MPAQPTAQTRISTAIDENEVRMEGHVAPRIHREQLRPACKVKFESKWYDARLFRFGFSPRNTVLMGKAARGLFRFVSGSRKSWN
jgi:hypothetical protein